MRKKENNETEQAPPKVLVWQDAQKLKELDETLGSYIQPLQEVVDAMATFEDVSKHSLHDVVYNAASILNRLKEEKLVGLIPEIPGFKINKKMMHQFYEFDGQEKYYLDLAERVKKMFDSQPSRTVMVQIAHYRIKDGKVIISQASRENEINRFSIYAIGKEQQAFYYEYLALAIALDRFRLTIEDLRRSAGISRGKFLSPVRGMRIDRWFQFDDQDRVSIQPRKFKTIVDLNFIVEP